MIELTLPLPPNRANAREHWRVTHRKKKDYYLWAERALRNHDCQAWRTKEGRVALTATLYLWNKMDRDNLMARLKWPLDVLVSYGLLVDDSEEWLDLKMPTQVVDRKNPRIEIQLKEAE
jgi:Holliday junction resolvase RusA-like endonuclease